MTYVKGSVYVEPTDKRVPLLFMGSREVLKDFEVVTFYKFRELVTSVNKGWCTGDIVETSSKNLSLKN
jgi:hypothetical protein